MGAVVADITVEDAWITGEDRTIIFDVKQSDGVTPQTMTGWALTWELKVSATGATSLSKTTASGIAIGNGVGTDDRATVTIAKANTSALDEGTYFHQLRRTDSGSALVLAYGTAFLKETGIS